MTDLVKFTIEERLGRYCLDRWVAGRETVVQKDTLLDAGDHAHATYKAHKSQYKGRSERKATYNVCVWVEGTLILLIDHKGVHADSVARERSKHHAKFG